MTNRSWVSAKFLLLIGMYIMETELKRRSTMILEYFSSLYIGMNLEVSIQPVMTSYFIIGGGPSSGYNINVPWENGRCGDAYYLAVWDHILIHVVKEFNPEMIIIAAGFDAGEAQQILFVSLLRQELNGYWPTLATTLTHTVLSRRTSYIEVLMRPGPRAGTSEPAWVGSSGTRGPQSSSCYFLRKQFLSAHLAAQDDHMWYVITGGPTKIMKANSVDLIDGAPHRIENHVMNGQMNKREKPT
ncbi:uncharacterized protein LOC142523809 [Primulina tabacum]|uniref:uncharacterized protein LOC142523809 n=1 Tax=Primulina tabacum TaxID=48773 RepID=UPI003F5A57E6